MRKYVLAIVGLVLLCLLAALGTASAAPDTVTVDSTTDVNDGNTSSISALKAAPGSDGVISLREAIEAANNTAGTDTIEFDIPATDTGYEVSGVTGTWTISLTGPLPTLTDDATIISGTSQAANQGDLNLDGPEIEISGASIGNNTCLAIESANNVVHGLVINRCGNGLVIRSTGANTNTVSGNYIGTDASGSSDLGNNYIGVQIRSGAQGNVVGGDTPEERNLISGNDQYAVAIVDSGTMSNTLSGNYIGTDRTGTQALPNAQAAVPIYDGAKYNTVGGDTAGERNVISGNGGTGVLIQGSGTNNNSVCGNFIGTDASGAQALGNGNRGVEISFSAQHNTVGGDTQGERNVISGNDIGVIILASGTMSNTVSGNYIGTDAAGSSSLGNTFHGVQIMSGAKNNTLGGQTAGERNVISGNDRQGVLVTGAGTENNTVCANYIGTNATGTQALANLYNGVFIENGAQNNTIGGQTAGERNVISGNSWSGVRINGADTDGNTVSQNYIGTDVTGTLDRGNGYDGVRIDTGAEDNTVGPNNLIAHNGHNGVYVALEETVYNTITENSIHTNDILGIDLYSGANGGISAPTVSVANGCFVSGTAGPGDTVEVFTGPDEEGKTYLATTAADGAGDWEIVGPYDFDTYVTATATDGSGNTSKFSTQVAAGGCYPFYLPLSVKNY